jgi:hypothetical protein
MTSTISTHVYEVRPRRDKRGVDLISDALPFGRLWSQIQTHAHKGNFGSRELIFFIGNFGWFPAAMSGIFCKTQQI